MTQFVRSDSTRRAAAALGLAFAAFAPAAAGQSLIYRFVGDNPGDGLGRGPSAVRGAGDFDNDGYDDIVAGAPLAGYVRVFSGRDGSVLLAAAGATAGDQFGYSASCAGDSNMDGFCDVVVGAPGNATLPGYARVFLGDGDANPANSTMAHLDFANTGVGAALLQNLHEPDNGFGRSVDSAFDFLGKGSDMVLIGADKTDKNGPEAGSASVWEWTGAGFTIRHVFFGAEPNARFGYSVAGLSDGDGDGFSDVVIASFFGGQTEIHTGAPLVELIEAASMDPTLNPVLEPIPPRATLALDSIAGVNIRAAGDYDNDEAEDIIVGGVLLNGDSTSGAEVYSGEDGTLLARLPGDDQEFFEGASVASVGDTNRDGFDDVVVASFLTQETRVFEGRTGNSFLGYRGETLADGFEDGFGFAVGAAGDVNQDGIADWCVSTTGNTVHVYSGALLFDLGDTIEGTVVDATDQDEAMLRSLKGATLRITMNGVNGGLKPRVNIFDSKGTKLASFKFQQNANGQKKKFKIPETGYYRVSVRGRGGSTGDFSADTSKSTFSGDTLVLSGKADASELAGLIQFSLETLQGATLTAKIKPLGGYPSIPTALLLSPFELPIPLLPYATVKNGSLRLKDVPLIDGWGTHQFFVYGGSSPDAEIFYKIKTKQPFGMATIDIDLDPPF